MEKRKQIKYDEVFMQKIDEMSWYVMTFDINTKKLENTNIFFRGRFAEDVKRILHKRGKTKAEFIKELNSACMYSFWSKCEYELVVSDLIPRGQYEAVLDNDSFRIKKEWFVDETQDIVYNGLNEDSLKSNRIEPGACTVQMKQYDTSVKIDVYSQLKPNMERLAEYIIKETGYRVKKENTNE